MVGDRREKVSFVEISDKGALNAREVKSNARIMIGWSTNTKTKNGRATRFHSVSNHGLGTSLVKQQRTKEASHHKKDGHPEYVNQRVQVIEKDMSCQRISWPNVIFSNVV